MNILNKSQAMVTVIMLCSAFSAHAGQVNSTANLAQHQMVESALVRKSEEEGRQRIKQELNHQREDDLEAKRKEQDETGQAQEEEEDREAKRKIALDRLWKGLKPEAKQRIQEQAEEADSKRIQDALDRQRKEDDLQIDRMIEARRQQQSQEIIPITAAIVEARRQDPQPLPLIERRKHRPLSVNTNIKQRRY